VSEGDKVPLTFPDNTGKQFKVNRIIRGLPGLYMDRDMAYFDVPLEAILNGSLGESIMFLINLKEPDQAREIVEGWIDDLPPGWLQGYIILDEAIEQTARLGWSSPAKFLELEIPFVVGLSLVGLAVVVVMRGEDQKRELVYLQARGADRGQLIRLTSAESAGYLVSGTILGLVCGVLAGWLFLYGERLKGTQPTNIDLELAFSWTQPLILVLTILIMALTMFLNLWRISSTDLQSSIRMQRM
jgi:ABC-type lipoprotein release transport system permease subunit